MPLQECVSGNGRVESGEEPEPHGNLKEQHYKKQIIFLRILLAATFSALLIAVIVLAGQRCECQSADPCPSHFPICPDSWVGYRGKCYYFSEDQGDWASSQNHCSAHNASLAGIDTWQDMDFMMRYEGKFDHWIALRRDLGSPWKWANGTKFNNVFPIGGRGDCAYLNDDHGVSSLQCTDELFWICSKPKAVTKAKETEGRGLMTRVL